MTPPAPRREPSAVGVIFRIPIGQIWHLGETRMFTLTLTEPPARPDSHPWVRGAFFLPLLYCFAASYLAVINMSRLAFFLFFFED